MDKQTIKDLQKIVSSNYNLIADQYSETRKKELWPELLELLKSIKDGSSVLDVGCGSGKLLKYLKDRKVNYLGVDPCKVLLNNAKENFKNYKFKEGDILNLGKISELNNDYVFCIAVLHHVPSKKLRIDAIKQLKNKIKDDGKIILSVWNLWDQKKYKKLIFKFWLLKLFRKNKMDFGDILFDWKNSQGEIVSKRYYHAFTKRELKIIVKKTGLKIKKIYKDPYNYYLILVKK